MYFDCGPSEGNRSALIVFLAHILHILLGFVLGQEKKWYQGGEYCDSK